MNTFGRLFTFTTFGESHGPGIGVVVDGCPARLPLDAGDIQPWLDRRRPGQGTHTTARREPDHVRILSGVHEGLTTGAPIALYVDNVNQHSADYDRLADVFRPGHADWTWTRKYGHRDPRGGGRTSARETLARVAAGAIARKMLAVAAETNPAELPRPITVTGALVAMGPVSCRPECWNPPDIAANPLYASDPDAVPAMRELLDAVRAAGSSVGGVVEVRADGVPPGWGEPLYDRLDARLAAAFMGVNAVKGVEIGDGFAAAALRGEDDNDAMRPGDDGAPVFSSNHAGGVLGGLSTGQTLRIRCALKPTPSIAVPQDTVDRAGRARRLVVGGRHDPCVAIRAVPVLEAMAACVLADFFLLARARRPLGLAPK